MAGVSALIDAHVPRGLLRLGRGRTVVLGSHTSRIDTRALDLHGRGRVRPRGSSGGSGPHPRAAGIVGQLPRGRGRTPGLPRGAAACDGGSRGRTGGVVVAPGHGCEVVLEEGAAAVGPDGTRFRRRRTPCQLAVRRRAPLPSNSSASAPLTGRAGPGVQVRDAGPKDAGGRRRRARHAARGDRDGCRPSIRPGAIICPIP